VPDEVIKYVLGRYGPPPAPIDPWVQERVLSLPRARELDVPVPEPTLEELRRAFGSSISDEELLLRWALPSDQVDAALARKTGNVALSGNRYRHPLAQLIAHVAQQPSISYFHLERNGVRLTLGRHSTSQ
jgi:oxaloacetate decarboxylase alpha subunit